MILPASLSLSLAHTKISPPSHSFSSLHPFLSPLFRFISPLLSLVFPVLPSSLILINDFSAAPTPACSPPLYGAYYFVPLFLSAEVLPSASRARHAGVPRLLYSLLCAYIRFTALDFGFNGRVVLEDFSGGGLLLLLLVVIVVVVVLFLAVVVMVNR